MKSHDTESSPDKEFFAGSGNIDVVSIITWRVLGATTLYPRPLPFVIEVRALYIRLRT